MSMTLEQVIADCEEEISDCRIDLDGIAKLLEEYPERKEAFAHEIDDCKKRMDYNRQLAEWLRELQERRKQPEIIRCGECKFANKPDDDMSAIIESYGDEVYCSNHDIYLYKGWYCGDGKRRTDATD